MNDFLDTLKVKEYDCLSCGSIYDIHWDPEEVDTAFSGVGPEFCPFCGEQIEVEELPEDLLNIDFVDRAEFGKGVDLVDGDGEED
jgi:hypothetical protein